MVSEPCTFWPLLGKQDEGNLRNSIQGRLNGSLPHSPLPVPGTSFREGGPEEVPQSTGRPAAAPGTLPALSISGWSDGGRQHPEPVWFTHIAPSPRRRPAMYIPAGLGPRTTWNFCRSWKIKLGIHQTLLALVSQQQLILFNLFFFSFYSFFHFNRCSNNI